MPKTLEDNNGKFEHFWLVAWPQVINKILLVWGPMSSCVKPLKQKIMTKTPTLHMDS
jgi:hypothetical protein